MRRSSGMISSRQATAASTAARGNFPVALSSWCRISATSMQTIPSGLILVRRDLYYGGAWIVPLSYECGCAKIVREAVSAEHNWIFKARLDLAGVPVRQEQRIRAATGKMGAQEAKVSIPSRRSWWGR